MQLEVLQYGYLGLIGLLMYLSYRIISGFHRSEKPFIQTILLVLLFMLISVAGGAAGYFWATKELEVAQEKGTYLTLVEKQAQIAQLRRDETVNELEEQRKKALTKANNSYSTREDQDSAMKRADLIHIFIKQTEENYQKELRALKELFDES